MNECGCWVKGSVADFKRQKQKTPRSKDFSGFSGENCLLLYALGAPASNIRVVWSPGPLIKFSPALLDLPPELRCMRYPIPYAGNARTHERAVHALVCAALGRARVVKVRGVVMAKRTPEICEPCLEAVTNKWPQGLKHFFPSFPMAVNELCTTTNAVSKTI